MPGWQNEGPIDLSRDVQVLADVVMNELESRIGPVISYVGNVSGHQVVHRYHLVTVTDEAVD